MLGQRLFILQTADLEDHVAEHGVSSTRLQTTRSYMYTVVATRDEVTSAVLRLENCIEEVSDWMSANRLKLNADKMELLWARSRHGIRWGEQVRPCGLELRRSWRVIRSRVLGVTMTSDLSLDKHVANVCATCLDGSSVHSMRSLRLRWSTLL